MTINVCVLHGNKAYVGSDEALSERRRDNLQFTVNDVSVKIQKFSNFYTKDEFIVTIAGQVDYREINPCGYHFIDLVKKCLKEYNKEDESIRVRLKVLHEFLKEKNNNPDVAPTYINIVKKEEGSQHYTVWSCELIQNKIINIEKKNSKQSR